MIVITGDGRIVRNLDRVGVVRELKEAQARGDKYCSVTGAIIAGINIEELEKEAGYTGASEAETIKELDREANKLGL